MALSTDFAAIIGFACEAVLYGANAVLFIVSLVILGNRRRQHSLFHPVVLLNCLIFLCCTTHFGIEFNHYSTILSTTGVNGYSNETMPLLGADILVSVTDFLGNVVLMYRCFMLWGNNPIVVILPFLAALGGLACIAGVANLVLSINPTSPAPPHAVVPLGLAGYTLPLCTNVIVTSLIVFRIWYTSYILPSSPPFAGQTAARRAMMLIIESGLLYLLTQLVYVVLFALEHPATGIIAVIAVQIYGIAPTLIIIRVALGISAEQTSNTMVSTRIKWVARHSDRTGTSGTRYTDGLGAETDIEDGMHAKDSMFKMNTSIPTVTDIKDAQDIQFPMSHSPASEYRE
ncbi:hypothetical protein ID866_4952 [Astraeus odoratus]|nr:hypothetical protein ID866_4952 [Astraeus odoratus]